MSRSILLMLLCVLSAIQAAWAAESTPAGQKSVVERFQLEEWATPVSEQPGWQKPKRILIVGSRGDLVQQLHAMAPGVEFVTADSAADAAGKAANVDAVIGACTPAILAAGKSIRWIQVYSAGVENCVSVPAVRERNIVVTNMQRLSGPIIAEHVMAMLLGFTRGLNIYIPEQSKGTWRRDAGEGRMTVIEGKTMLVVGLGGIGTSIAQNAHALGMKVVATRASGRTGPKFVSYVGLPDELNKLAAQADVVVNATPLTPQTTGIFNAEFFKAIKPGAYFINIGRGKSVVTPALVDALASSKVAGAGLDVTDPEPLPPNHPLWKQNVIITPHVSNDSDLGFGPQAEVIKENVRRYVSGGRMLSVVDLARGY